ncbi:unnamed protein product [Aspergillus oryzae var. brunneus]|uniref:Unnamed protein product n=1 Tax=Aspergillus oryzae var. brunneus TaxID=332754 RepID=A0ABQ6KX94_ASPOZ|nr:unnamed protein product [Aspergillus oryzae var. brunneus]
MSESIIPPRNSSGSMKKTIQPTADWAVDIDHGAETDLQRTLSTRHITMIALGSSIGMGLWLGSGTSLANGGPAAIFIGYLLSGTMIWSVSHSIGEMAVMYPLPSAFIQWTSIFVDPAAGFALGWAYWFSYWITIANELQGPIGFRYWNSYAFTNGFKGFLSVMPTCIFAMSGSENCALVAAETSNPRRAVPKAVGSIWLRLSLFYILGSFMITITVDPKDNNLFGASGVNASPFVIAYRNAGLEPLAHIMNAVVFISVVSTGSISGYAGSRALMGLAHVKMAPKIFGKADKVGRPLAGLFITLLIGGGLGYLNVNNSGEEVFTWFSNLTSLFTLFGWGMICLSHLRMRYAWKVQGRDVSDLPWKSWTFPYAAIWGLGWCILLIIAEFYLSVWPLGGQTTAKNFFANYVSVVAIVVIYIGAKIYYRGPFWVDSRTIDLDSLRRFYVKTGDEESVEDKPGAMGHISKAVRFLFN